MFLQIANTYKKKKERQRTREKVVIEKEELVVKENVILIIDGEIKEKRLLMSYNIHH